MFRKFSKEFLIHNNKDDQYHPSIVRNSNKADFDVTWTNKEIGTTSTKIMLKHYSTKNSLTDSLAVNGDFATNRMHSKIIYLANGNQLVTWCSDMQDNSGFGVYATILSSSGSILKDEFRINTYTASNQEYPSVEPLANGGFIIVWQSLGQDTKQITSGVFAKVFNSTGDIAKEEFQVNDYTANNQDHPVITVLDNGNYIIAWQSFGQDSSGRGVFAKIYDPSNIVVREEFKVNTHTANDQEFPNLAKLADNKFIVVWQSSNHDGSEHGVYAKIFNSFGDTLKEEFKVNSYTEGHQKYPAVTMLSDESFIIVWQSLGQDGAGNDIYAQKFTRDAIPLGEEFIVNDYTENHQERPRITSLTDGSCAIIWQSFGQDGYKSSVFGQIFTNENNTIYDQTTNTPTTSPTEAPFTTDAPTQIVTSTVAGVAKELPTFVPDTTTAIIPETHASTAQSTAVTTQLLTKESIITSQPTSLVDITVVPQNTPMVTEIIPNTQTSTVQSSFEPQPLSTLGNSITTLQPGSTENSKDSLKIPSSTNPGTLEPIPAPTPAAVVTPNSLPQIVTTEVLETIALTQGLEQRSEILTTTEPTTIQTETTVNTSNSSHILEPTLITNSPNVTSAIQLSNFTTIQVIINNTVTEINVTTPTTFYFSDIAKFTQIYANEIKNDFVFSASTNSLIKIDGFGDTAILNFTRFSLLYSRNDLNITRGSTHIHLPGNQTIIIANKYPEELKDKNFAFASSRNVDVTTTTTIPNIEKQPNEQPSETSSPWWSWTLGAGALFLLGAGGAKILYSKFHSHAVQKQIHPREPVVADNSSPYGGGGTPKHIDQPFKIEIDQTPNVKAAVHPNFHSNIAPIHIDVVNDILEKIIQSAQNILSTSQDSTSITITEQEQEQEKLEPITDDNNAAAEPNSAVAHAIVYVQNDEDFRVGGVEYKGEMLIGDIMVLRNYIPE